MNLPPRITTECRTVDRELDQCLGERAFNPSPEVSRHLHECDRCRRLYLWITETSADDPGSPELYSRIERSLKASINPVEPQPPVRSLALRFLIVFMLLACIAITIRGPDGMRQMDWPQRIGITALVVLAGVLVSISLAWQMTPGSLQRIPARITILVLTIGFLLVVGFLFPWQAKDAFFAPGWHCFKTGMAMAAPAALLFYGLCRRGAPLAIGSLAATLGGIAGLFGAVVLQFTCSRQEAVHLLVWHGGVIVASIITGMVIAPAIRGSFRPRP